MSGVDVPKESELTAVIHAVDGVRFIATARHADALAAQIVGYIRERCDHVLWPNCARTVHTLLADGNVHAAIALYFARVGERWDEEYLDVTGEFDLGTTAGCTPAGVAA